MKVDKDLRKITSALVSGVILMTSVSACCSSDVSSVRRRDRSESSRSSQESEETGRTEETTAAATTTIITTEETTTSEETTEQTVPSVVTETSYLYDEFHVNTDWDNYVPYGESQEQIPSVYSRISEEAVTEFVPSEEYGRVYPFIGFYAGGTDYGYGRRLVGLFDENGRIICDPIFDGYRIQNNNYLMVSHVDSHHQYGFLSRDGSSYSGQIYVGDSEASGDGRYMVTAEPSQTLTVFDRDGNVLIPQQDITLDWDFIREDLRYGEWFDIYDLDSCIMDILSDHHALLSYYATSCVADLSDGSVTEDPYIGVETLNDSRVVTFTWDDNYERLFGLIDLEGNTIVPPEYDNWEKLDNERVIFRDGDTGYLINAADGSVLGSFEGEFFTAAGMLYVRGEQTQAYDRDMNPVDMPLVIASDDEIILPANFYYEDEIVSPLILLYQPESGYTITDLHSGERSDPIPNADPDMVFVDDLIVIYGDSSFYVFNRDLSLIAQFDDCENYTYRNSFLLDNSTGEWYFRGGGDGPVVNLATLEEYDPLYDQQDLRLIDNGRFLFETPIPSAPDNYMTVMTDSENNIIFSYIPQTNEGENA